MDLGLKDKHVFLTGASGGIGLETAMLFLKEGAKLSLQYNSNFSSLQPLLSKFPNRVNAVKADVRSEKEVVASVEQGLKKFGPIHILVANHGVWVNETVPIIDMTLEQWETTLKIDLTGVFLYCRETLRQAKRFGVSKLSIVIVGSTAGIFGEAGHSDYASAKSALMYGFLRSLKNEVSRISENGRANVVAPGWVLTPMAEAALKDKTAVNKVLQTIALKKVAKPFDVASAIVFLSSTKVAGHVSGEILEVTGGMEGRVLYTLEEIE